MKKKLKVVSFFAGVGGIDLGFEQTGHFKTVYANEFDRYPANTMQINFPDVTVDVRDIHDVQSSDVPDCDVIVGGFPCQAFSVAGYRKGFDDEKGRGNLFFEMLRIIKDKKPRVVFAENVKNLMTHDNGNTYRVIKESLEDAGYHVTENVMNACEYGNLPQNRERIYIIAFRTREDFEKFEYPLPIKLTASLKDVVDYENEVDEKYYYTAGKYKGDIYDKLVKAMEDPDAVYQWRRKYVRKNQSGVVPTLTANMGEGGHNVPLVKTKYGIRKLTPRECFNAQGYPKDYKLPSDQVDSRLYKQAGNSVCVPVIRRIAEEIYAALARSEKMKEDKMKKVKASTASSVLDSLASIKEQVETTQKSLTTFQDALSKNFELRKELETQACLAQCKDITTALESLRADWNDFRISSQDSHLIPKAFPSLSPRSRNALIRTGIVTIGDLKAMTYQKFLRIRNIGKTSQLEILRALRAYDGSILEGTPKEVVEQL